MSDTTGTGDEDHDNRTCAVCGGRWTVADGHACPGPRRPPKRRPKTSGSLDDLREHVKRTTGEEGGALDADRSTDAYWEGFERGLARGSLTDEQREAIDAAGTTYLDRVRSGAARRPGARAVEGALARADLDYGAPSGGRPSSPCSAAPASSTPTPTTGGTTMTETTTNGQVPASKDRRHPDLRDAEHRLGRVAAELEAVRCLWAQLGGDERPQHLREVVDWDEHRFVDDDLNEAERAVLRAMWAVVGVPTGGRSNDD